MTTNAQKTAATTAPREGRSVWRRSIALAVALLLVILGLFPAPLIVLRDPAWRADAAVRRFVDEPVFWFVGLLVIIAPVVMFTHQFRDVFDETWTALRSRLNAVSDRRFMVSAAIVASALAAAVALWVFSRSPTTSDEVAQLWHARILLEGRLSLPVDHNPEFFAVDNVVDQGRWYSQFPIGWPVVLALAMALKATWLLNPLLAGLVVVNVYRFTTRAYRASEARLAAVLCATCPYLLIVSGSYMNHTVVAFFATLALAELPVWIDGTGNQQRRAGAIIGLSLGSAIAVRPLDGAVAALVFGALMLRRAVAERRVTPLVLAVAAGAIPIAALLVANQLTTGDPFLFGYNVLWGPNHTLGFHADPLGHVHTRARALEMVIVYLMQLNWSLFGWPVAGLLVVAGALIAIDRLGRWDAVLLAWIAAQLLAYSAYFHVGQFLGPRYLFTVVPAFLILVSRGIVVGVERARPAIRRSLTSVTAALLLAGFAIPRPPFGVLGAAQAAKPIRSSLKRDLDPALGSVNGKALIFVSEPSSNRLTRRLWSLGISRADAMRLMGEKDHCALLDAAVAEERRAGLPAERLARLERTKNYTMGRRRVVAPDPTFRVSDVESITPTCWAEGSLDASFGPAIAYGPALLRNEIGSDGRIAGPIVIVADMSEHNEVLRARFGDRPWYRLRLDTGDYAMSRLVPYR